MYLPDLLRDVINAKVKETFIGKTVTISEICGKKLTFVCKDVKFGDDDGDVWLEFTSDSGKTYITDGQGFDIWYEIKEG